MAERQYLVHFGPDANCTFELCTIDESVYAYRPSLPANIVFAVIFALALIVHAVIGFRWKTPAFMWCMIVGCLHEIVGYVGRIILWNNPWSFTGFIIQIICITQAPVFYCAAIYVTLGRTIEYCSPALARFSPSLFIKIFLPCDIISLVLQGAGGALSATSSGASKIGVNIAMAGLIFQIITLIAFCGLFLDYMIRYLRSARAAILGFRQKLFFGSLTFAIVTILARCIFRADELKDGYDGKAVKNEALFIGLEGVLVVVAIFALCIGHPGFLTKSKPVSYGHIEKADSQGNIALSSLNSQ